MKGDKGREQREHRAKGMRLRAAGKAKGQGHRGRVTVQVGHYSMGTALVICIKNGQHFLAIYKKCTYISQYYYSQWCLRPRHCPARGTEGHHLRECLGAGRGQGGGSGSGTLPRLIQK